jgi:HAD superfamily hydrolase (TIGR01549 family)
MAFSLADVSAVIFDVDGTLIDSNAAHAETWARALSEHGFASTSARIRPLVGMGSDKLLPMVGLEEASAQAKAVAHRKKELFAERLPRLQPTPGARALVSYLRDQQKVIVIATSAGDDEMNALLRQAGVGDLIPTRTSSDDADRSKPDPDIVIAAWQRTGAARERTVMIGDTPYDVEAARRAGILAVALRCGGHWFDTDLKGAIHIADDPAGLLAYWQRR